MVGRIPSLHGTLLALLCTFVGGLSSCVKEGQRSSAVDDIISPSPKDPRWLFSFPDCLPSCTDEDRRELTERGRIEDLIVAAIDAATTEASFSMYTFSRKPIYEALVRAASRGVKVQGIVDRGQFRNLLAQCTPEAGCVPTAAPYASEPYRNADIAERIVMTESDALFQAASLTERLALLFYDLPSGSAVKPAPGARRLVHNKFVMIDDRVLVNGSGNWSSTAVSINLENLARLINATHPAYVTAFTCAFDVLWTGNANDFSQDLRRCETADIKFAPAPRGSTNAATMIAEAARQTSASIQIAMHHLTHRDVYSALEEARSRGVSVQLLFDDDDCNAPLPEDLAALIMAGAEVRYMPTNCSLFQLSHNKFGIFDEQVINGSGNWSNAGLTSNYENFIRLRDANDTRPFQEFFARAWSMATERSACTCQAGDAACLQRFCVTRPQ